MSRDNSRTRSVGRSFSIFMEALIIFILLISGIGVAVISKIFDLIAPGIILLAVSVGVEIAGIIIVALYFYFRSIRRSEIESE